MRFLNHTNYWRLCVCTALFFMLRTGFAQQPYFQQQVDYTITVALNDEAHTLSAFEKIKYVNHSPQPLSFLYFHLWPNAYKNNGTALAKQLLEEGKSEFYFSSPQQRGFIDSLDFKVNGQKVHWQYDSTNIDICRLTLDKPLQPFDSIEITTPFFVKIPDAAFSRLGHTQQAYFITQWYPKPAVYDREGWHQMPYLDQGEFYSEFGSFDVSITLPGNYVLCATGDRVDAPEEEKFLDKKVEETIRRLKAEDYQSNDMTFPPSSSERKTVRFKQHRVHDFAWFADKRFNAIHDQVQLRGSKKTVDTWVFFTNKNFELWRNAISYVNESTLFYSALNGDYPYNHVTALDGTIIAGGGMEYPNITVIGDVGNSFELDVTITHEVGHNWFYGILASNERDHPFMDEGVNSLYEMRYIRAKYPASKLTEYINRDSTFKLFRLNKTHIWKTNELAFFPALRAHTDQPMDLTSSAYTTNNYGSVVYSKTALVFDYLMDYMGAEQFDKAMKAYFERYKFKHPSPEDLINTLSASSGKDLSSFAHYLIHTTEPIDYKLKKIKRESEDSYVIKIKNKSSASLPFNVYGFKNNVPVSITWFDGFNGTRTVSLTTSAVDYFKIDGQDRMPDINRKNNSMKTRGLFKKAKPLQLSFAAALEDPDKTQINYLPAVGANYYNGFMLGAILHNYSFYEKKLEYSVTPMYAFRSKTVAGFADVHYNFYPKHHISHITLGVKAKSFAYDYLDESYINEANGTNFKNQYLNYYKLVPFIQFELKKKVPTSPIKQVITYSSTNLFTDSLDTRNRESFALQQMRKKNVHSFVNQLEYYLTNSRVIDPFSLRVNLQHTASMAKLSATLNYKVVLTPKYYIDLRAFAGAFLAGSLAERGYYSFRAAGYTGYQDYLFDGNFMERQAFRGVGFSQFMETDGDLKVYTPLGQSAQWLAGINIKSPRLFILPVKVFADVVACDNSSLLNDKLLWDAGLNITIFKDIVEVYVPVVYDKDIKQTLKVNSISFFNRIRFTFNIHKLDAKKTLQSSFF